MKTGGAVALLVILVAILAGQAADASEALAPSPAAKSLCKLPSGVVINAPESENGAQFLYYDYSYSVSYVTSYYYTYFSGYSYSYDYEYGGRRLLDNGADGESVDAPAPAPGSDAPLCCPTTDVKQGDTVDSLLSAAGQTKTDSALFYALNQDLKKDKPLEAGTTVTVPCYRFTAYLKEKIAAHKHAPAPAPAETAA